jgi:hypothetical protein
MEAEDQSTDAAWGFKDAAKAIREIIKIFDDVVAWASKIIEVRRRHQLKKAARALNVLRFKEGGFVNILRKIETGDFTEADVAAINDIMHRTRREVVQSFTDLHGLTDLIRERVGLASAAMLEGILYGDRSKDSVRSGLNGLTQTYLASDQRISIQKQAHTILADIAELNLEIIRLHDVLIEEAGERRVRQQKAGKRVTIKKNP